MVQIVPPLVIGGYAFRQHPDPRVVSASTAAYWLTIGAHMMANWWSLSICSMIHMMGGGISETPSCHRIRLRKTVDHSGAVAHTRSDAMLVEGLHHRSVPSRSHRISRSDYALCHLCDSFQFTSAHNGSPSGYWEMRSAAPWSSV